jgi:hypothetical protein
MNRTTIDKLVTESLAIEAESAKDAGTLGYMARAMVQATMPHKRIEQLHHERVNGDFRLTMVATSTEIGLPYGSIPRLMLAFIGGEAVRTQQREIVLGDSMSAFMVELGMAPTGGRWGSITRLKEQSKRLLNCAISTTYSNADAFDNGDLFRIGKASLWWDVKAPEQIGIFQSTLELSETLYNEITSHPIPVDMRALRMLKKSPLALDVYCWLAYRIYTLNMGRRPSVSIPWQSLQMQFGAGYPVDTKQGQRNFKKAFIEQLKKIHILAYQDAKFELAETALTLFKSPPALPPRQNNKLD